MERLSEERLIELPVVPDESGNLGFIQSPGVCPFEIKRVFYMYDLPVDSKRGGHSHLKEEQLIVSLAGSFAVNIFDGVETRSYLLDSREKALYVPAHLWRTLDRFTENSVCLVLSSTEFSENDYIRSFDRYMALLKDKKL